MIVAQRELAGGRQEIVAVDTHVGVTDVLARPTAEWTFQAPKIMPDGTLMAYRLRPGEQFNLHSDRNELVLFDGTARVGDCGRDDVPARGWDVGWERRSDHCARVGVEQCNGLRRLWIGRHPRCFDERLGHIRDVGATRVFALGCRRHLRVVGQHQREQSRQCVAVVPLLRLAHSRQSRFGSEHRCCLRPGRSSCHGHLYVHGD